MACSVGHENDVSFASLNTATSLYQKRMGEVKRIQARDPATAFTASRTLMGRGPSHLMDQRASRGDWGKRRLHLVHDAIVVDARRPRATSARRKRHTHLDVHHFQRVRGRAM